MAETQMDELGRFSLGPKSAGLYYGDAIELMGELPNESIDSIFTDPPWSDDALPLFRYMAREAGRVLKPGGLLMTFTGKASLDTVTYCLSSYLNYHWMAIGWQPQSNMMFMPRRFMEKYRPALIYSKGKANTHPFVSDARPTKRDKRYHEWGQGKEFWTYYINLLGGEIILDPFCGGGTTAVVCKELGKQWLTFENMRSTYIAAEGRIRTAKVPLFTDVDAPEQQELI